MGAARSYGCADELERLRLYCVKAKQLGVTIGQILAYNHSQALQRSTAKQERIWCDIDSIEWFGRQQRYRRESRSAGNGSTDELECWPRKWMIGEAAMVTRMRL